MYWFAPYVGLDPSSFRFAQRQVRVRFAGKTRTVNVKNGRAVIRVKVGKRFSTPRKGRSVTANVRYLGTSKVAAKTTRIKVRVTRCRWGLRPRAARERSRAAAAGGCDGVVVERRVCPVVGSWRA